MHCWSHVARGTCLVLALAPVLHYMTAWAPLAPRPLTPPASALAPKTAPASASAAPAAPEANATNATAQVKPSKEESKVPGAVLLLTSPKTGSTSLLNAFHRLAPHHGFPEPMRFHSASKKIVAQLRRMHCTEEKRCMVVSTVRKPGRQLVSLYFQGLCGTKPTPKPCEAMLALGFDALKLEVERFLRQKLPSFQGWWTESQRRLRQGGLNVSLEDLRGECGESKSPRGTWVLLRFGQYEEQLRRWFPTAQMPHSLDHRQRIYKPQYEWIMSTLANRSTWPLDLQEMMEGLETMRFFYPGQFWM
ncbi:unnamed protein product [Effrenium voratum]|uniref:Sulfotransferase n=1 Tax=Effrenium voratum TaxID=2562239 RepID=A0AA36NA85_9DINO|nr:unnamed protein product [Effrenium voratum]CAJ1415229.1 unnamed protein product [Effrenium voratum]